jgi:transcriptional regulator with AAA-type ATPase domain/tetratricopeptide (TPR) repeat protein
MDAPLSDLLGRSAAIRAVHDQVLRLLERQRDAHRVPPVLIQGETGTGKGLLARLLHRHGPRRDGPFVDVNCAAIPETMLEAEMFGFERGAFTDARRAKPGLLQAAHRGTIFLDEIGLLSEALQAKLLKALEDRTIRRLGSTRDEPIDVWIISATNEDLGRATKGRRFREDLYHRLAVVTVALPPLRDRGNDVELLAEHFLARACADYGLPPKTLSAGARARLAAYAWPGNVRELNNVIERTVLLSEGASITPDMLALPAASAVTTRAAPPTGSSVDDVVREELATALRETGWNISQTAARLGITRNTVRARIAKYQLRADARDAVETPRPTHPVAAPEAAPAPVVPTLRWERRRVMFMKADVIAGDEVPTHVLSRIVQALIDKAQSFGARLEEIRPTGILAVFGLDPGDDAPRAAAHAAVATTRAVERVRAEESPLAFAVRVTLHLAAVGIARVGSQATLDPDSKRDALAVIDNVATLAPEDGVLVTESAARYLARRFELTRVGEVGAYGLRHARERVRAAARGTAAVFVGRERELELLRAMFDATAAGGGTVVAITGEAGLGKSRLLAQFQESLGDRPFRWVEGRCLAHGTAVPYLPIVDLVRSIAGVDEDDRPEHVAGKLGSALARLDLDDANVIIPLWQLLGLSTQRPAAPLAPDAVKAAIFEAIHRLVAALSARGPLVMVVEDLHWIDSLSSELLASLASSVSKRPIMLVTTYRPGYRPPWIDRSYATQLALPSLTRGESRTLVQALMDSAHDDVIDVVLEKAEGNPLFLEELVLTLREQPGHRRDEVPETIHDVIVARIDRLSPEHRRILQAAAVVGRDVPFWLLRAVTDDAPEVLREALAALRLAEFLYDMTFGEDPDHVFKHALTHDVAYATLADTARRDLHRRVVDAIERRHPAQLADHAERLAYHASRGELWSKAVGYWRQAGQRALAHSSHEEAVACFEQALDTLRRLPAARDNQELGVDVRFELRSALLPLGQFTKIVERLQEAQRLAEELGDRLRLGRAFAFLTDYFRQVGDHARGLEAGQRGHALAAAHGDLGLDVTTQIYLAHVFYDTGDFRSSADLLRRTVAAAATVAEHERFGLPYIVSVHARTWLSLCLAELGDFDGAIGRAREAMRIAEAAKHPSSLTSAHVAVGRVFLRRGDIPQALPVLEQGLALCRQGNMRLLFPFLAEGLGLAYAYSNRIAAGLDLLREAQEMHERLRGGAGQALRHASLSQGHLVGGDITAADRFAESAVALARSFGETGYLAYALFQRAEVSAARREATAPEQYRDALMAADKLQMLPLVARCRLGLGVVLGERAEVVAALDLLSTLGMPLWREQAEQALATLR